MDTKLAIVLGVILAILAGVYFLSPQANAPSDVQEQTTEVSDPDADTPSDTSGSTTETIIEETSDTTETTPAPVTQKPVTSTPTPAPSTQAPAEQVPYDAVVIFDGGRFIPDEVTIIKGGTVRFINATDKQNGKMWIATDNHPTHDRYPIKDSESCSGNAFDECEGIEAGEYWDFAFTETGTWGYHNEADAKYTGSVKVMTVEDFLNRWPQN